jgi:hypothetical protein
VFSYETTAGTRYRFNAGGTTRRGFKTPEAALIEKGRFEERRGRGQVAIGRALCAHVGVLSRLQAPTDQRGRL